MANNTLLRASLLGVALTVPLIGCRRNVSMTQPDNDKSPPPAAIGGGPVDVSSAVDRIIAARCARESSCGFIGSKWASDDACREVVTREYSDDLTESVCPNGIDPNALSQCVQSTREADCNAALDVIGRVPACRTSALCRK